MLIKEKPIKAVKAKAKTPKKKRSSFRFKFKWEDKEYSLTPKQRMFCEKYFSSSNATQAAIAVGYSAKTAHAIGPENLSKPSIQAYNDYLLDQNGFNVKAVFKEHLKLINQNKDKTNKKGSIDMYYRLKGNYAPITTENKTTIKFEDLDDEELDKAINAIKPS